MLYCVHLGDSQCTPEYLVTLLMERLGKPVTLVAVSESGRYFFIEVDDPEVGHFLEAAEKGLQVEQITA